MPGLLAAGDPSPAGLLTLNGTLLFEIVAFLVVLAILWRWVYPPVMRVAERRERAVAAGLQKAQEAERRLSEVRGEVETILDGARVQVREVLGRAHREASADVDAVREKARREADAEAARARQGIAAELDRALRGIRAQEAALVAAAADKVLGETLDPQAHRGLIERSLASLES
jgi:F-type H+-transporting ATPase subunit b